VKKGQILRKFHKNNHGLTLVELIVAMAVFTVVTTSVTALLVPIMRTQMRAIEAAEYNTLLNNVANQIISDMRDATPLSPTADPAAAVELPTDPASPLLRIVKGSQIIVYSIGDDSGDNKGLLLRSVTGNPDHGTSVLPSRYYRNNRGVSFDCKEAGSVTGNIAFVLTVSITNRDDSSIIISRDYAVSPLALNQ
jgi:prepilin-type N-terminal cleavage/methylation domain-containing protein